MEGIDVHGDKGRIDWKRVADSGVTFAFVKCSEGLTFEDARIAENLANAHAAGVKVGPYHYARPDLRGTIFGATAEAEGFVKRIKAAGWDKKKHLRPVLDLEEGYYDLSGWSLAFLLRVEEMTGVRPILYTYTYFVRSHLASGKQAAELAKFPLWLANYGANNGTRHGVSVEKPWTSILVHQYTSRGSTPGVSGYCDRNFTEKIAPLLALPAPEPKPVDRSTEGMWLWIRWWRGHGEFAEAGARNPAVRPSVPHRIPAKWWVRLALNLGHLSGGGGGPRSQ